MTKMNYTRVRQEGQARRYGRDIPDDLPAFGTWADIKRCENQPANETQPAEKKRRNGPIPKIKYGMSDPHSRPRKGLAKCPVCGQMVGRMLRHLSKAHGSLQEAATNPIG